ncbi:signaling lymphocytic activation molecule-like [Gymnodraco acuticeps]|uniref:Signaling lymphocytic activation molecule-like n=1 Tax=Gymnodraco acuticeps TaxID=8218 RepID=A0A6P8V8P6_GYMAC|nr:signaling lymphocytic activation molecule-like [Gymnodraco acuticeps]XP_034086377.1 signaling lymphocytic activation molecule-like [Gymnodraco acuticeps]
MVGGCQSCLLTYMSVLLLGCFLHDVEASNPQHEIHTKVGDTVELSSGLSTKEVTKAEWNYEGLQIADDEGAFKNSQFDGRLEFNPDNFSLTLRELTLKDSGKFSFNSAKKTGQRPTVTIILYVHEPITKEPIVNSSSTWHTSNASCTVLLECSAATTGHVTFQWTVGTETFNGFRLQHILRQQDEDTKFNCTISNVVSEMSTIKTVSCSNTTFETEERGKTPFPARTAFFSALIVGAGGCLLVAVIVGVAVCAYRHKQSQAGVDSNDLTVYADINDVAIGDKPCSLYETIDNRVNTVPPGPNTVYDKIQLNRLRNESVSPYQDIS